MTNWEDIAAKIEKVNKLVKSAKDYEVEANALKFQAQEALAKHDDTYAQIRRMNAEITKDIEVYRGFRKVEGRDEQS